MRKEPAIKVSLLLGWIILLTSLVILCGFTQPVSKTADDGTSRRLRDINSESTISVDEVRPCGSSSGDGGQATAAQLDQPHGIAVDSAGNLYFTESNRIRKITTKRIISTVVDLEASGVAQYAEPKSVAINSGNLYFLGYNRILKVKNQNKIAIVRDLEASGVSEYDTLNGIAVDSAGNFFIADSGNNRVLKVTSRGITNTVAELVYPTNIAVDSLGNLYIVDAYKYRILKVDTSGIITTIAGNGTPGYSGDGGPATSAQLRMLHGLAVDSAGNFYFGDDNRIRKVTAKGIISTVAGNGTQGNSGDGGLATAAQLYNPFGVAVDSSGNLYISDYNSNRIRKVTPAGIISTVAGKGPICTYH